MKSGVESEDSLRERERVSSLQYWQHPLKKKGKKRKNPKPCISENYELCSGCKEKEAGTTE